MARVFVVASDVGPSGAAEALADAIRAMPAGRHAFAGIDLDGGSPFGFHRLRHHPLDPRRWRELRRAIRGFEPHVVHALGREALHAVVAVRSGVRLAFSGIDAASLTKLETRTLPASASALVHSRAEKTTFGDLESFTVPFGVASLDGHPTAREASEREILFGGSLDAASEPLQAAWAFDVLKYARPGLELVFPDQGRMREPVERLSFSLGYDDYRVRFRPRGPASSTGNRRPVVWLTQSRDGTLPALKAVAAGHAVLAMRTPELAEYCSTMPGVTLVPAGDRVSLASATLKTLDRPDPTASAAFPLAAMVDGFAAAYDTLATDAS